LRGGTGGIGIEIDGKRYEKRFVLRYPEKGSNWNDRLLVGAHGGAGGLSRSRSGNIIDTGETALDDLIGEHALDQGYAYASVDRDGIGGTREGRAVTYAFTEAVRERLRKVYGKHPVRTYLAGFSAGGAIARYAAEDTSPRYDGIVIIAGGSGDAMPLLERQAQMAVLWPDVDPVKNPDLPTTHPKIKAYAAAVATPLDARRLWPFVGARQNMDNLRKSLEQMGLTGLPDSQLRNFRVKDHTQNATFAANLAKAQTANPTGKINVPVIEVTGTYDDIAMSGILAYKERVRAISKSGAKPVPADIHRLYQVEGVWHISVEDDAIPGFQYTMSQMGLDRAVQDQLTVGGTYIPTVREAIEHLDRWVSNGKTPPPDQTVKSREALKSSTGKP